jgi:hypothetical protein
MLPAFMLSPPSVFSSKAKNRRDIANKQRKVPWLEKRRRVSKSERRRNMERQRTKEQKEALVDMYD